MDVVGAGGKMATIVVIQTAQWSQEAQLCGHTCTYQFKFRLLEFMRVGGSWKTSSISGGLDVLI